MNKVSRRRLAGYATTQLLAGQSIPAVAKHLSAVLVADGRENELEFLISDISRELEERGETAQAKITTANTLSDKLRREITDFIKQSSKVKTVSLQENVDKSVLGGLRIETSSRLWDKTVAKSLLDIREAF